MASTENLIQNTPEWVQARVGLITASRIADVLASPTKGQKEATTRRNYKAELVCERMTSMATPDGFQSWDMKRGLEQEPEARVEYELLRDVMIRTAGFVVHPKLPYSGASPDGLINGDGQVQFKCAKPAVHLDWLRVGRVPAEHIKQMQWEMACTGRKWNDFVSYCPNFPDHLRLFVVRLERDDVLIAEIEREVIQFNTEIEEIIGHLPRKESLGELLEMSVEQAKRK